MGLTVAPPRLLTRASSRPEEVHVLFWMLATNLSSVSNSTISATAENFVSPNLATVAIVALYNFFRGQASLIPVWTCDVREVAL